MEQLDYKSFCDCHKCDSKELESVEYYKQYTQSFLLARIKPKIDTVDLANTGFTLIRGLLDGRFDTSRNSLISRVFGVQINIKLAHSLAEALHSLPRYDGKGGDCKYNENLTIERVVGLSNKNEIFKQLLSSIKPKTTLIEDIEKFKPTNRVVKIEDLPEINIPDVADTD